MRLLAFAIGQQGLPDAVFREMHNMTPGTSYKRPGIKHAHKDVHRCFSTV